MSSLLPGVVRAEPVDPSAQTLPRTEEARGLFDRGVELIRQQRWSEAEVVLQRSHSLVPRSSTLYNLALALLHVERGREALEVLTELHRLSTPEERETYDSELGVMRKRALALVGHLDLRVTPSSSKIHVDGELVPGSGRRRQLVLDAGTHRITVAAPGFSPQRFDVSLVGGHRATRSITLQATMASRSRGAAAHRIARPTRAHLAKDRPEPPEDGSPHWVPYGLIGIGAAMLGAAGITGFIALDANRSVHELCPDTDRCDPALRPRIEPVRDKARDYALASDILWISGAVATGAGLALIWFGPAANDEPRGGSQVALRWTATRVELAGKW